MSFYDGKLKFLLPLQIFRLIFKYTLILFDTLVFSSLNLIILSQLHAHVLNVL